MKYCLCILFSTASLLQGYCQSSENTSSNSDIELFIVASASLYLPVNTPDKGVYPILGYDGDSSPKFQTGGFGIGVSLFKPLKNELQFKGHAGFSRQAYWDAPYFYTDDGVTGTRVSSHTYDYTFNVMGMAHYLMSEKFSMGTGLGAQTMIVSVSKLPEVYVMDKEAFTNKQYKRVLPFVPLEASLKSKKMLFTLRYEYGLMNRLRGDLAENKKDRYSLLVFEIGIRIK